MNGLPTRPAFIQHVTHRHRSLATATVSVPTVPRSAFGERIIGSSIQELI